MAEDGAAVDTEKIVEAGTGAADTDQKAKGSKHATKVVPDVKQAALYDPPEWAGIPRGVEYSLEVIKSGTMVTKQDISAKDHIILGRSPIADVLVEHPSASRCHAIIQFNGHTGEAFLFDAGSTHGTFLNKRKLKASTYAPLRVGDMFSIGASSRLYILSGPMDLMPQEGFNKQQRLMMAKLKEAEKQKERDKQVAAAQMQSALSGGASWGFGEDAVEDEMEDLSWKVHALKSKLTQNQQKLADKIRARELKINHMRKECERVEANGRAGGGLTDGQRAVLVRNEQAIERMTEEIDDFEEDLKDSIRESLSAKSEKADNKSGRKRQRRNSDDEYDDMNSDEDEYFDRTLATAKKKKLAAKKANDPVLTPEMLHTKRMDLEERKTELARVLVDKHSKSHPTDAGQKNDDELDSFMSGVHSQLEADKIVALESELEEVGKELEEVGRLLKISDPEGFFNPINVKKRKEAETRRKLQEEEKERKRASDEAAQLRKKQEGISSTKAHDNSMPPPPSRRRDAHPQDPAAPNAAKEISSIPESILMPPPPCRSSRSESSTPDSVLMPPPPPRQIRKGVVPADAIHSQPGPHSESTEGAEDKLSDIYSKPSDSQPLSARDAKAQREVSEDLRALSQATKRGGNYGEVAEDVDWKPPEGQTGDGRTHLNAKFGY